MPIHTAADFQKVMLGQMQALLAKTSDVSGQPDALAV